MISLRFQAGAMMTVNVSDFLPAELPFMKFC